MLALILALTFGLPRPDILKVPIVYAQEIDAKSRWIDALELQTIAVSSAKKYHLTKQQTERMLATISCESSWVATSTGAMGERGLAQIYPKMHQDITTEQMIDPYWSLDWMAHQFMDGHTSIWVCYTMLYGQSKKM